MSRNRTLSFPDELDEQLKNVDIDNLSGLVAELLTREIARRQRIVSDAVMGIVTIEAESESRVYKFRGEKILNDGRGTDFYRNAADDSLVIWNSDGEVEKHEDPSAFLEEYYSDVADDDASAIAEAFGITQVVWL